ncbi:6-phosphogluconolactonase [Pseudokineococcus basanitobsidens]|uniref:6-phosphogluconolactonase n=1 Tax=Pseudokineococcus basanitobsidens TaxID=1926649 RepID=A0ABU8RI80_9ACTN
MTPGGDPGQGVGDVEVALHEDAEDLARTTAARLISAVADVLGSRPAPAPVHVVLTGGRVGGRTLEAVAAAVGTEEDDPADVAEDPTAALDWSRVHLWFGDERLVEASSDERNDAQARAALGRAPLLAAVHWHPMPSADDGLAPVDAAARYAAELAEHAEDLGDPEVDGDGRRSPGVPAFDVLMLGVGPDGHVASLFPGRPTLGTPEVAVVVEDDAPKPPALRLSLGLDAIRSAVEVWLVVAGDDKARAVARGLDDTEDVQRTPAVAARGRRATRWLVDRGAASRLAGDGG